MTAAPSPSPRASYNPFRPLVVHRNFRIFLAGQTLSLVGTWMQSIGEGWLALELSNRPLIVGLVAAAASFPVLVLSLYGGVVADRVDKLRLVKIAQSLLLVQASVLWWLTYTHRLTIPLLVGLALVNGIVSSFEIPARQSFIVELVGREDLVDAIALNSGGFNLARVIGPSIAAVVIGTLGIPWCFGLNALSYLAVLGGLFMIRLPKWERIISTLSPWEGMKEGFLFIRNTPVVFTLVQVVAINAIFALPFLAMMPVFARDVVRTGASGYGFLLACVGVGAFAGALALASLGRRIRRGPAVYHVDVRVWRLARRVLILTLGRARRDHPGRLGTSDAPHRLARQRSHASLRTRRAPRTRGLGLRLHLRRPRPHRRIHCRSHRGCARRSMGNRRRCGCCPRLRRLGLRSAPGAACGLTQRYERSFESHANDSGADHHPATKTPPHSIDPRIHSGTPT